LIELEAPPGPLPELKLAPESASAGDFVHSFGNPGTSDAYWIYTSGTVRQVYHKRVVYGNGQVVEALMLETQAPINPGDSGGPVVNDRGDLVGVSASYRSAAQLVSNCIDVSEVRAFLAEARPLLHPHGADGFRRRAEHYLARGRFKQA